MGNGECGAPESSQFVGLRTGWGGIVHLPFLLSRELPITLAPLVPLPLLRGLANCPLCFCLRGTGIACLLSTSGWNLSLPECSTCLRCPALLITTMYSGFMLLEQISRARYSVILGSYSLPAPFLFLLPVSCNGESVSVPPDLGFAT